MKKTKKSGAGYLKILLASAAVVALILVLVPQREQLKEGLKYVLEANPGWILAALGCLILTYLTSSAIYVTLAKKPIKLPFTFLVQVAASFANRILPSGIGGLGLNADYLIKNKHTPVESGTVVAVNSFIAFLSYNTLILLALLSSQIDFNDLLSSKSLSYWVYIGALFVILSAAFFILKSHKIKRKIVNIYHAVIKNLKAYKAEPSKLFAAYIGATAVTIFFICALFACSQSVGLDLTLIEVFAVYTAGIIVGAAVMTPGGLVGVEAGMYGALVALGNDPSLSFAAVIIYRLVTYWLPIVPGIVAFMFLRKRKQI